MRFEASRPFMPGYALLGPSEGRGLLPWSWAEERLVMSHNYWLSTVSPAGRPHAMAVWGVWHDGTFFFSTGAESRKTRNLAHDARCSVSTENATEAVVVEGEAHRFDDAVLLAEISTRYAAKYEHPAPPPLFRVLPETVFGFIEHASEFSGTATRWRVVRQETDPR